MYHIVADSGCDIFEMEGVSLATAPLTISTDKDDHFVDDETLNVETLVDFLHAHKGKSFTACPSTGTWLKAFELADGSVPDELYIVTLTSGLSGTYNSANVAKDIFLESHPETKAIVIDSLSVGPEMRLIMEKIRDMKQAGCSFEEVAAAMKKYVSDARLLFAFKSLHNLAQNGRVNKVVAAAAGALGITVYGCANEVGQIESHGKARGDKRVVASLYKEMLNAGYHGGKVRITHVFNPELAGKMAETIREGFPDADICYYPVRGLCSYYCERAGMVIGYETND